MSVDEAMGQRLDKSYEDEEKRATSVWYSPDALDVRLTVSRVFEGIGAPQTDKLPDSERKAAEEARTSLLFGEVALSGVEKMFTPTRLHGAKAKYLLDLGHGCGRLLTQAFVLFPNIMTCKGVEFSRTRFELSCQGLQRLSEIIDLSNEQSNEQSTNQSAEQSGKPIKRSQLINASTSSTLIVEYDKQAFSQILQQANNQALNKPHSPSVEHRTSESIHPSTVTRTLTFEEKSLFDCSTECSIADVIVLETNIYVNRSVELIKLINHCKNGAKILCYNRLEDLYQAAMEQLTNDQSINESLKFDWVRLPLPYGQDHYDASWGTARFYIYELKR